MKRHLALATALLLAISPLSSSLAPLSPLAPTPAAAEESLLYKLFLSPRHPMGWVPEVYGTAYDCRPYREAGTTEGMWRGLIGGRALKEYGDGMRPISREGCFKTKKDCEAFIYSMDFLIQQVFTKECDPM